jgi:hypothetical protein
VGGCTNCRAKSGCDDRKGDMLEQVGAALERLYPTHRWGEPDDLARFQAGICEHDGRALAAELAQVLEAPTWFRAGEPEEYCDYVYVLCVGREPSLARIRDGGAELPSELDGLAVRETYLRLCLSTMARLAAVQQVAMELDRDGGDWVVREKPRAGVYDGVLLSRLQRLVATLPAYDILHVDFGEISAPPSGFDAGEYPTIYGVGEPDVASYLFFPQPSTMQVTTVLDASPDAQQGQP